MITIRHGVPTVLAVLAVMLGACAPVADDTAAGSEVTPEAAAQPTTATDDRTDGAAVVDELSEMADEHGSEEHAHEHGAFAFGAPADPADADRTVEIRATDAFAFEPATIDVRAGEVITFEVTNVGQLPHDFTLGDETAQQQHAREMEEMGAAMQHTEPNAMTVEPGETGSLTWRFDGAGAVLYGCHQPGHYEAGMVGAVDVAP